MTKRTACDKIAKLPKEQKVLEKQKNKKVVDKQNELWYNNWAVEKTTNEHW